MFIHTTVSTNNCYMKYYRPKIVPGRELFSSREFRLQFTAELLRLWLTVRLRIPFASSSLAARLVAFRTVIRDATYVEAEWKLKRWKQEHE